MYHIHYIFTPVQTHSQASGVLAEERAQKRREEAEPKATAAPNQPAVPPTLPAPFTSSRQALVVHCPAPSSGARCERGQCRASAGSHERFGGQGDPRRYSNNDISNDLQNKVLRALIAAGRAMLQVHVLIALRGGHCGCRSCLGCCCD